MNTSTNKIANRGHGRANAFVRRLARSADGGISVEFAFLVPILAMMVVGAADFGRLALRYAEAKTAASAAIQYATQKQANAVDEDGLRAVALAQTKSPTMTVDVDPPYCQCAGEPAPQACSVACPDADYPPMYLQVTVRDTLDLMFSYPGVDQTQTVTVASHGRLH